MAGVGKILKQAQKMQKQMDQVQKQLESHVIEVSSGGGAIQIQINGQGHFLSLRLDPEFMKESSEFVAEALLEAVRDAAKQAKDYSEAEMSKVTAGLGIPGLI